MSTVLSSPSQMHGGETTSTSTSIPEASPASVTTISASDEHTPATPSSTPSYLHVGDVTSAVASDNVAAPIPVTKNTNTPQQHILTVSAAPFIPHRARSTNVDSPSTFESTPEFVATPHTQDNEDDASSHPQVPTEPSSPAPSLNRFETSESLIIIGDVFLPAISYDSDGTVYPDYTDPESDF
ncbi:hypothetical protein EIP91_009957 [Steccherinum ochraceum]|uniref:Uncharacterized protein n=1 Tax=Steccherinum ochraceum TaxID=92696 RepID=A0A4R0R125_9APHY|nr:hypothetical protein EIP91_009957 [Steccherinum ochraceum]